MILKGGQVAFPNENDFVRTDILVKNGKIAEFGNFDIDDIIIDAENKQVFPGGIDPHVHFDDPGFTHKEDFATGTMAAAQGGITTIIDMPCTSVPPVTNINNLKNKLAVIEPKSHVDFCLFGGISSQSLESMSKVDIESLAEYVVGYKIYTISGMEEFSSLDSYEFGIACEITQKAGSVVLVHAEEKDFVNHATQIEVAGGSEPINYYRSRPEIAEILAIMKACEIAKQHKASLHIVHVGTSGALEIISQYKTSGLDITCETAPHYLEFTLDDFERIGSPLKITPPIKKTPNKEHLWEYLINGDIDFVASDHAPATYEEKNTGSIWSDYGGIPGTVTLLPYIYSEGFRAGKLTLRRTLEIISANAAKRYGINNIKGSIEIGKDADFVIINPNEDTIVKGADSLSKGKITPFENMSLRGRIEKTILRGNVIYDKNSGIQVEQGYGKFIKNRRI